MFLKFVKCQQDKAQFVGQQVSEALDTGSNPSLPIFWY